jgi:hypothetical protein
VESAPSPLAAVDGVPPERLPAATRFDLRERPERRPAPEWPAPEWPELRSAQELPERAAARGLPAPGLVSALRAQVRCVAVEAAQSGSRLARPVPVRCAAKVEAQLAQGSASLHPRAVAVTAQSSPAPFPFPAPAVWQVLPVASEQQAAPPLEAAGAALDAKALVPQAGGHVVVPQPAVAAATAAQQEAEPPEVPVAPVARPWVLPWALPSAAAWAFHRGRLPPWPARRPVAWSVRAMEAP